jgi:hypothetical protein
MRYEDDKWYRREVMNNDWYIKGSILLQWNDIKAWGYSARLYYYMGEPLIDITVASNRQTIKLDKIVKRLAKKMIERKVENV